MTECPINAGSTCYNYNNFDSIVLLAECDANYCFTLVVGIGSYDMVALMMQVFYLVQYLKEDLNISQ